MRIGTIMENIIHWIMYDKIIARWCALQSFEAALHTYTAEGAAYVGSLYVPISAEMKTEVSAMTAETEK